MKALQKKHLWFLLSRQAMETTPTQLPATGPRDCTHAHEVRGGWEETTGSD